MQDNNANDAMEVSPPISPRPQWPATIATMPTRTPAQASVTDYDPAYHTFRFEMLAVLSRIHHVSSELCERCEKTLMNHVHHTYTTLLTATNPPLVPPDAPGSRICRALFNPNQMFPEIRTTANPHPVMVEDALETLLFHDPSARETILDRLLEPLYQPHQDTPNLLQTQIWYCLAGGYTLVDALQGRSIADFARMFQQLFTNLTGGRARADGRVYLCPAAADMQAEEYGCFGGPVPGEYPFGGDVEAQTACVLEVVKNRMDGAVWALVREGLYDDKRGWPEGMEGERDWLVVLRAVEEAEWFKEKRRHEEAAEKWRARRAARRAAQLAGREGRLLLQEWDVTDPVPEYGDE
ncbi:hypothetical protein F5144DRAFT_548870 [Chaetomium tenue]|uniref:Uncharacterized protein n=1 Tax=Chaetomium tenue TaxID=1854479 RepID=A0ACB7P515_9PEZI|nr:hypothetical protein F5144DRAFT_548870 [Chaetomium globosum]